MNESISLFPSNELKQTKKYFTFSWPIYNSKFQKESSNMILAFQVSLYVVTWVDWKHYFQK